VFGVGVVGLGDVGAARVAVAAWDCVAVDAAVAAAADDGADDAAAGDDGAATFAAPLPVGSRGGTSVASRSRSTRRRSAGPLTGDRLAGGLLAARLATDPLVALLRSDSWTDGELAEPEGQSRWAELASLQRVEVYQATGMIVGAFDVDPAEALVLLRAQAYIRGVMASELALDVVERRVLLDDAWRDGADRQEGGGGE
jgi:hypothetical protein